LLRDASNGLVTERGESCEKIGGAEKHVLTRRVPNSDVRPETRKKIWGKAKGGFTLAYKKVETDRGICIFKEPMTHRGGGKKGGWGWEFVGF